MTSENVIRGEAYCFFNDELFTVKEWKGETNVATLCFRQPKDFKRALEERLNDFFSNDSKSIFLDEVKFLLNDHFDELLGRFGSEYADDASTNYHKSIFYIQQFIEAYPAFLHENSIKAESSNRNKIFISYSQKDITILDSLKRHFKILEKGYGVEFWDDSKIVPGQKWEDEIRKAMTSARVALFIVSADFFASDFIVNNELPTLLEKAEIEGATILTVLAKPCDFLGSPLAKYQAVNAPNNTILNMNELQQEELWVSVVSQIRRILNIS